MRQLFEKKSPERLKTLHWESTSEPTGRFCYFLGSPETSSSRFNSLTSVMGFKGRQRLESRSGVICDSHFFSGKSADELLNGIRKAIGTITSDGDACGLNQLAVFLDFSNEWAQLVSLETLLTVVSETLEMSLYSAKKIEHKNEMIVNLMLPIAVTKDLSNESIESALAEGIQRGKSFNYARYLGDLPANTLYPQSFATLVEERLASLGQVTILDDKELESQGFGGLIAVGKGSKNKPRLAIFEAGPKHSEKTIVLVGKGVTFDTGGYSIKQKQHHNEMKYDMCGAANVLAALEILAPRNTHVRIIGLFVLAENMVSADAQRPGDVYKAYNGKTIEVYNTDAEGRLMLADALAFAHTFNPTAVIDIATLTGGASHIAGNMAGILCTNDDSQLSMLKSATRAAGEKFVHLEILDEALEDLSSEVADLTNMHNKWSSGAPTMYAAAFLKEFVPSNTLWVHLDIANVAWSPRSNPYLKGRGATSFGARSLINIVSALCL